MELIVSQFLYISIVIFLFVSITMFIGEKSLIVISSLLITFLGIITFAHSAVIVGGFEGMEAGIIGLMTAAFGLLLYIIHSLYFYFKERSGI